MCLEERTMSRRSQCRPVFRPQLERLEDRTLPSATLLTHNAAEHVASARDAAGNFVAAWEVRHSYKYDERDLYAMFDYDLYAQRFDASGQALGAAFLVSSDTVDDSVGPRGCHDS